MWNAISGHNAASSLIEMLSMMAQVLTGGITASYQSADTEPQAHLAGLVSYMLDALSPSVKNVEGGPETVEFYRLLQKADEKLQEGDRLKYQMAMCLMLSYRRVFVTAQGHLGLGHSRVLKGDSVVWLYGGKLPFLLRSRHAHWIFGGECFLHGLLQKISRGISTEGKLAKRVFELR